MNPRKPPPTTSPFQLALLLLALTTFPSPASAQTRKQCFYPDGASSDDVPCDANAEVSMCCGSTNLCLSSGLCRNPGTGPNDGTSYARGTCTDREWASDVCPQRCRVSMCDLAFSCSEVLGVCLLLLVWCLGLWSRGVLGRC